MNEIEWSMSTGPTGPQHHAQHRGLVLHVYSTGPEMAPLAWQWVVLNDSGVIADGEAGAPDEAKAAAEKWVRALAPFALTSAAAPTAEPKPWGNDFDLTTRDGCAGAIREVLSEAMGLLPHADHSDVREQIATSKGIADSLASLASLLPDRTTLESIGRLQLERDAALQRAEREQRTRAMVHVEQQQVSEIIQAQLGTGTDGLRGLIARVTAGSGTFDRDDAIVFFTYLERVTKALEQVDTILNPPF